MTDQEARIARIAFELAADLHGYSLVPGERSDSIRERFIQNFNPERPCQWRVECVETGRCPREVACDN